MDNKNEDNTEYLYNINVFSWHKQTLKKLIAFSSGLYYTFIHEIESHIVMAHKASDPKYFTLWHDCLGNSGSKMIWRIIENSCGHPLKNQKILLSNEFSCVACSQRKFIIRPWPLILAVESPAFLERIQGDLCGLIQPTCGPFRYFMVLRDVSARWSHACLLSTRNVAFVRFLYQIIQLRT